MGAQSRKISARQHDFAHVEGLSERGDLEFTREHERHPIKRIKRTHRFRQTPSPDKREGAIVRPETLTTISD